MSETTNKISSFVKEVLARIKGDDQEVAAIKIERKSRSAIGQQINALESKVVDDEDAVKDAEDVLTATVYPTDIAVFAGEKGSQNYINAINNARKALETKKDNLEETQESLAYFKSLLASFD
jgi:hypothetical protein